MYCFFSVMTQEDFRRLKRGKLLILLIEHDTPCLLAISIIILGPMNKHFDSVDPDELVPLLLRICTVCWDFREKALFNNTITISTHDNMKLSLTSKLCVNLDGRIHKYTFRVKPNIKINNKNLIHYNYITFITASHEDNATVRTKQSKYLCHMINRI